MTFPTPGVCRYCGCTEANACPVPPYGDDDTCSWMYGTDRTVCTGSTCIQQFKAAETVRHFATLAKRPRRLSSAEVHAQICKRKPRKKRAA